MLKAIENFVSKLNADLWCYCLLGVIAVVFIAGLVLAFVGGDFNRFLGQAKKFLKMPVAKNATETAKNMPVKIRKLYKRAKTTGEKPSDVINFDACISSAYASSMFSRFTRAVLYATALCTAIAFGVLTVVGGSYAGAVLVSIVGGLLTLVAGLISVLVYNGAVKTYNAYVDALDKLSKGGNYEEPAAEPTAVNGNMFASAQTVSETVDVSEPADEVPVYSEPETVVSASSSYDATFERSNKLDIEIEEEEPVVADAVVAEEPVAPVINNDLSEIEEEIRREKEAAAAAAAAESAEQERRRAAIEKARAQAAEKRSAVSAERPAQTVVTAPPPPVAAEAPSAAASGTSSADSVIARIEQINKDGAPLTTMKEVALLLQQERMKPENKTPEQQRRLNEALSSLLKSMSAATKK